MMRDPFAPAGVQHRGMEQKLGRARICRAVVFATSVLTAGCSPAEVPTPPPTPQPPPSQPTYREAYADAQPTGFPSHFAIDFTREYGNWEYRSCALKVRLYLRESRIDLACCPAERAPKHAGRILTADESGQLQRLAERAELCAPGHIGLDLTATDGIFDTIRFRPIAGGRAVVLVTSGNRSFVDNEARRGLREMLNALLTEMLDALR